MYRVEFDIVAIILCLLTLAIFYLQKQVNNRRSECTPRGFRCSGNGIYHCLSPVPCDHTVPFLPVYFYPERCIVPVTRVPVPFHGTLDFASAIDIVEYTVWIFLFYIG